MILYGKYLLLICLFTLMFAYFPQFIHTQIKKLLVYHNYKEQPFRTRIYKIIKIYIILGLIIGIMNFFILTPTLNSESNNMTNPEIIALSFIMSFSLVLILRLTILLDKSKIIALALSDKKKKIYLKNIKKIDFKGIKGEIESFLFSIFLAALISLMLYFFHNLLFNPSKLFTFNITSDFQSLFNYILFVLAFAVIFIIISVAIELILKFVGVNNNCSEEFNEEEN